MMPPITGANRFTVLPAGVVANPVFVRSRQPRGRCHLLEIVQRQVALVAPQYRPAQPGVSAPLIGKRRATSSHFEVD